MKILLGVAAVIGLSAQTADAPVITAEDRAEFWRAAAELRDAQIRFRNVQDKLSAKCSEKHASLGSDQRGEPVCVAHGE